jgi:hypothetical protein
MASVITRGGPAGGGMNWVDRGSYYTQEIAAAEMPYATVDYESITVGAAAVGFDAAKVAALSPAGRVSCRLLTAQINYRADGNNPTDTEGTPIEAGVGFVVRGRTDAGQIRFIRTGSTSGVLKCHYEDVES